jgi:hypothetical protein
MLFATEYHDVQTIEVPKEVAAVASFSTSELPHFE